MDNTSPSTFSFKTLFTKCYHEWCLNVFLSIEELGTPSRIALALEVLNMFVTRPYKFTPTQSGRLRNVVDFAEQHFPLTSNQNANALRVVMEFTVPEILFNPNSELYQLATVIVQMRLKNLMCIYLMSEGYFLWPSSWKMKLRKIPLHKPSLITLHDLNKLWACRTRITLSEYTGCAVKAFPPVQNKIQWGRDNIPWNYRTYFRNLKRAIASR